MTLRAWDTLGHTEARARVFPCDDVYSDVVLRFIRGPFMRLVPGVLETLTQHHPQWALS